MSRRSSNQITKEQALKLVKKLKAKIQKSGNAHDYYVASHEGKQIAILGIRHSPKKDKGHGHIPGELGVGPRFAREMAICNISREEYLGEKGLLEEEDGEPGPRAE